MAAAAAVNGSVVAIAPKVMFSYTGREQTYVVPPGVVMAGVAVEGGQFGAQGGEGGGRDGGVGALLPVTPGEKLFVEVGSAGVYGGGPVFGGGGAAGQPPPVLCKGANGPCGDVYASSGGGAQRRANVLDGHGELSGQGELGGDAADRRRWRRRTSRERERPERHVQPELGWGSGEQLPEPAREREHRPGADRHVGGSRVPRVFDDRPGEPGS